MRPLVQQFGEQHVAGFFLVLARVSPLFILAPLFSSRNVPPRARVVVALALSFGLAPVALQGAKVPLDVLSLGGLVLKEILVGLAFAYALAAMFAAIQAAGTFVDTVSGFSYGALVDPLTGNQSSVMTQVYALVGIAIFVAIGGDAWVIQGLARTYDVVPMLATPELGSIVGGSLNAFGNIMGAGLEVAAPVVLAVILTDAAFGFVSRVVPQLNVFAVGFPAKMVVALLVVGVSFPFVAGWLGDELERSVTAALQVLRVA